MLTDVNVAFILTSGMLTTGTSFPYEMWLAAIEFSKVKRRGDSCSLSLVGFETNGRSKPISLTPDKLFDHDSIYDVIYLPALWRNPTKVIESVSSTLSPFLINNFSSGAQIAAVGSGVSLLASSGLLDFKAATTHWHYFERFRKQFPNVDLRSEFFITQAETLYCAASINSLADVTVHLIESFFDIETAMHVERNFSHEIRRSYDSQRFSFGGDGSSNDELVIDAISYIRENVNTKINAEELANLLGVSRRTLDRRFKSATGVTLKEYRQRQRLKLARELLSQTDLPIGEVAWRVGYLDQSHFSLVFKGQLMVTPYEYRKTVRAKLFVGSA